MLHLGLQLGGDEAETTVSQADSSDDDDDIDRVDYDVDDDDKEWMTEASDASQLDNTRVFTTRQVFLHLFVMLVVYNRTPVTKAT